MNRKELQQAQRYGAMILSVESGEEMEYKPRYRGDRQPWIVVEQCATQVIYRCSSDEVEAKGNY